MDNYPLVPSKDLSRGRSAVAVDDLDMEGTTDLWSHAHCGTDLSRSSGSHNSFHNIQNNTSPTVHKSTGISNNVFHSLQGLQNHPLLSYSSQDHLLMPRHNTPRHSHYGPQYHRTNQGGNRRTSRSYDEQCYRYRHYPSASSRPCRASLDYHCSVLGHVSKYAQVGTKPTATSIQTHDHIRFERSDCGNYHWLLGFYGLLSELCAKGTCNLLDI